MMGPGCFRRHAVVVVCLALHFLPVCLVVRLLPLSLLLQADLPLPVERLLLYLAVVLPLSASSYPLSAPVVRLLVVFPLPVVAVVLQKNKRLPAPPAHATNR